MSGACGGWLVTGGRTAEAEAWWETDHWSGLPTMPDADRPVDVDDTEERDR